MEQQRSLWTSYYSILGVSSNSKRAYRKLAMRWYPDRYAKTHSLLCEAKIKFQQIQEAYSGEEGTKEYSLCVSAVQENSEPE